MAKFYYILMGFVAIAMSVVLGNHHQHGIGTQFTTSDHKEADIHALTSVSEEIDGISHRTKSSGKKGEDTKEDTTKTHAEKGGKTTKDFDEDYEEGEHSDAHEGHLKAYHKSKKAQKNGKSEKGFSQSFRKREYRKLNKFFGDAHKGGDYNKFGSGKSKKNSQSFAKDAGKHKKQVAAEGKTKKP